MSIFGGHSDTFSYFFLSLVLCSITLSRCRCREAKQIVVCHALKYAHPASFCLFLYKKCGFFIRWCRLDSCCLRGCRGWLVRLTGIPRRRLPLKNDTQQCAAFCPQTQHWKIICLFTRKHNYVKGTVSPKSKIVKFYNIDSCNLSTYYATFT